MVLLAYAFSAAHWRDFVRDPDGKTWAVLAERTDAQNRQVLDVATGIGPWRVDRPGVPVEEFAKTPTGQVIRHGVRSSLSEMNPLWLAGAAGAFLVTLLTNAARFWYLLRAQSIRLKLWEAIRLTFLGQFFNMVVPGTVGGDVVKAWYVAKHTERKAAVLVTIFFDRLVGLIELVLMAGAMLSIVLIAGLENPENLRDAIWTCVIVLALCGGTMLVMFSRRLRRWSQLPRFYRRLKIYKHIQAAGESVMVFRRRPSVFLGALGTTFISHVFLIMSIALLGLGLGLLIPLYEFFVYTPLIYIIGAVPITPGGVGVVENLFVTFFESPVVSASAILTMAMLARVIPIFWGLPGLVVAVTGPKLPPAEEMAEQLEADENAAIDQASDTP